MKKLFCLFITIMIAVMLFAACVSIEENPEGVDEDPALESDYELPSNFYLEYDIPVELTINRYYTSRIDGDWYINTNEGAEYFFVNTGNNSYSQYTMASGSWTLSGTVDFEGMVSVKPQNFAFLGKAHEDVTPEDSTISPSDRVTNVNCNKYQYTNSGTTYTQWISKTYSGLMYQYSAEWGTSVGYGYTNYISYIDTAVTSWSEYTSVIPPA